MVLALLCVAHLGYTHLTLEFANFWGTLQLPKANFQQNAVWLWVYECVRVCMCEFGKICINKIGIIKCKHFAKQIVGTHTWTERNSEPDWTEMNCKFNRAAEGEAAWWARDEGAVCVCVCAGSTRFRCSRCCTRKRCSQIFADSTNLHWKGEDTESVVKGAKGVGYVNLLKYACGLLTALCLVRLVLTVLDHVAAIVRGDAVRLIEDILAAVQLGRLALGRRCNVTRESKASVIGGGEGVYLRHDCISSSPSSQSFW